jgi:hypothetical protein
VDARAARRLRRAGAGVKRRRGGGH